MDLDVRLLGPLEVEVAGDLLPLGGLRSHRLLAVMLLNANSVVRMDRLVDVMWESAPQSARQQIHNTVATLRRAMAPAEGIDLVTSQLGYRIVVDSDRLDLTRYRAAVREADQAVAEGEPGTAVSLLTGAQALWRGSALTGLGGEYFENVATRLSEEYLATTESLMDLRVQLGESARVVGELTELVASHPSRQSLRATLMAALHSTGRQADALEVYEEGRRVLVEEFGLDPSDELKALHERILRGLPVVESAAVERPSAPPPQAAPASAEPAGPAVPTTRRFLPHDSREFSGRQDEILQLMEDSRQTESVSLVISAINGMGGIGKTALAVHFAHTVSADYPDGQYFVDLRGFTAGVEPLSPEEALGHLLRQCGLPDELIPPSLEDRTATWRSAMADRRALVLLDNALGVEQVRPLLPGTHGPLVLITSRRRMPALEGVVPLSLDLMPQADAVALFLHIVGPQRLAAEEDAEARVAELVELCGRLPLAVRIAAGRFRERTSWTMPYLIQQLSDQKKRARFLDFGDRSVSAVISMSYRSLSEEHRRLFRLLSLQPGPNFTPPVAAALADMPIDRAEEILESLFDDNLVLQEQPDRYHFHDLVRDYASQMCAQHDGEEDRKEALARLFDHYLRTAATWCAPLATGPFRREPTDARPGPGIPVPSSAAEAVELLAGESVNLVEAARTALSEGPPDTAWQLVCTVQPFLRRTNYAGAALKLFEDAVVAARSAGDERGEALILIGLAGALRQRGRSTEARAALEAGIAISRRRNDRNTEMYQLTELGVIEINDEHFGEAYESFRSALAIAEARSDQQLSAILRNNLGVACRELGRGQESFAYFSQVLDDHGVAGGSTAEASTLVNIGVLLVRERRSSEAIDYLDRALVTADGENQVHLAAEAQAILCEAYRALGDVPRSFETGRTALRIAREHKLLEAECYALNGLGEAYLAVGDLDSAEATFRHAVTLSRESGLRSCEARALEGSAHIALYREDLPEAARRFEVAASTYPAEAAEAENPRVHLVDLSSPGVRCNRCLGSA
ncbi:AfsR/SARP family transcriptional regulator [Streptacidiphilus anmyonensis]|uniref:AfsR/SARP family transcriptional regulator n=1 Tax=Streptacidiphilus anmyonensis TaxID=405782 RepID=UPI0006932D39|nr:BTAD domain-containing putative transcriptional regulator [Streptacidiphilus anmyonensis]